VIVFIDESGLKESCNCVALGAVAFRGRRGVSYLELGAHLVENLKRMLHVGGELKWLDVRRRGNVVAIELIRMVADIRYSAIHYTSPEDLARAVEELASGAKLVVVDNQLLPRQYLKAQVLERDSRRVPGLQLADVVAGYARSLLCRSTR
jgi:hypothetical protein